MRSLVQYLSDTSVKDQFKASLSSRGGYITFSNSGRRGESKQFEISLDSIISTLKDIIEHIDVFYTLSDYDERSWRDAGTSYFSDPVANSMSASQTKPFFVMLSKLIKWANDPKYSTVDTSNHMVIDREAVEKTISSLDNVADEFTPQSLSKTDEPCDAPLQQIFFGAPGTGKSHAINEKCAKYENYRTTFHPDTDYASFVGSYKPITVRVPVYGIQGTKLRDEEGKTILEDRIVYKYVFQSFLKAYIAAWREQQSENPKPVFLVVEEINRGNCAQIFGDIFQLLDRNESGFSEYPIVADDDLAQELKRVLKDFNIAKPDKINAQYDGGKDVVAQVKSGSHLLLPNNLYIWATMNTSDQSLFPIDSAFKRRWDWKYIKIKDADKGFRIVFSNGNQYDWWQFVSAINTEIEGGEIQQEDKKLGYFFAKARDGKISAETFVSKVLFYLYNDVFKDFGLEEDFFKDESGETMSFSSYYDDLGNVDENRVEQFIRNLDISPLPSLETSGDNGNDSATSSGMRYNLKVGDTNVSLRRTFYEITKQGIQNNPSLTFDELRDIAKECNLPQFENLFLKDSDLEAWKESRKGDDASSQRYLFKDPLTTSDNVKFYVWAQWGFLDRVQTQLENYAKKLGVKVSLEQ